MGEGEKDSSVCKIALHWPHTEVPQEPLAIGKSMESWKLIGCKNSAFTKEFLRSARGQSLTTLCGILEHKLDNDCIGMFEELLSNRNLEHLCVGLNQRGTGPLMRPLSELKKLNSTVQLWTLEKKTFPTFCRRAISHHSGWELKTLLLSKELCLLSVSGRAHCVHYSVYRYRSLASSMINRPLIAT
jgi:hypothetical protein